MRNRILLVAVSLLAFPAVCSTAQEASPPTSNAGVTAVSSYSVTTDSPQDAIKPLVAKLEVAKRNYSLNYPWRAKTSTTFGTGVFISPRRILTNARVVTNAHRIRIQQEGKGREYDARVVGISYQRELAVVEIGDDSFSCGVPILPFSQNLPKEQANVKVFGCPIGGKAVSVTKGTVSRIEHVRIAGGGTGFRVQTDIALTPGTSGGPAVINSEIAGLVTKGIRSTDKIGYLVSAVELQRFLRDLAAAEKATETEADAPLVLGAGKSLRLVTVTTENEARRDFFKLDDSIHGRQVVEMLDKNADSALKVNDIILSVGGNRIDFEGDSFYDGWSIPIRGIAQLVAKDDSVEMKVFRDGAKISLSVPLTEQAPKLVQRFRGKQPEYILYGPIVFTAAPDDLISTTFKAAASESSDRRRAALTQIKRMLALKDPILIRADDPPDFEGQEVVVVANILKHHSVQGTPRQAFFAVKKVNDVEIKNLRHLADVVSQINTEHVVIEFYEKSSVPLIVDHQEMLKVTDEVMDENSIRRKASPGMSDIWRE